MVLTEYAPFEYVIVSTWPTALTYGAVYDPLTVAPVGVVNVALTEYEVELAVSVLGV
jgi:hypothetical protein